jgi:hypothetical protein
MPPMLAPEIRTDPHSSPACQEAESSVTTVKVTRATIADAQSDSSQTGLDAIA